MLDDLYFSNVKGGAAAPKLLNRPNSTTAGGEYMAKLGDYMFSLDTAAFQQLQRDTQYRWSMQKRIGRASAAQFTGLDDDTIELAGVIYPHFRGGIRQLGQMRATAGQGVPLPLVYAFDQIGQYCGQWCIKSIREGRTVFNRDGTPKKIEFSLALAYYGEDDSAGAGAVVSLVSSVAAGFAVATAVPVPALIGAPGTAMVASAVAVQNLPAVMATSPLGQINNAAQAVKDVAKAAGDIARQAQATIKNATQTVASSVIALIPPEARTAASELVKTAETVKSVQREVEATMAVFKDSPADIRRKAKDFDLALQNSLRGAVLNGGTTKAAAIKLAAKPSVAGQSDIDRMTAAASINNITRASDELIFACSEASRQVGTIVGKIDA